MNDIIGYQLTTAVVFFIFNRPDTTRLVFEQIKLARPPVLFIIADGPRVTHPNDRERCMSVRELVAQVDWPCEVYREYSDVNLGCRQRISTGLDRVFSHVAEAIILEDDCLPHSSFFRYCEELLDRYRDNEQIKIISGNNYLFKNTIISESYYFSSFTHIWGWATWARTWKQFNPNMDGWPELLNANWLKKIFPDRSLRRYWERVFEFTYKGLISTWDSQLNFSCLVNNGLAIVPSSNLVTNIGFGSDATITRTFHCLANVPNVEVTFPLVHPATVKGNYQADLVVARNIYFRPILPLFLATFLERIKRNMFGWLTFICLLLL